MDSVSKVVPVDLSTYLRCYGSTLPKVVKITEGFYGEDTLEADQILVIYKVEKQKMLIGLDHYKQEVCIPRNSKRKVLLLPPGSEEEYNSLQELFDVHRTLYFRVLEDIPSHGISSETTLILLGGRPIRNNSVKCELIGLHNSKEIFLPIQLRGKFQPLLDAREYYLEEVLEQFQVPVNIRFVYQSQANTDPGRGLLTNPGNVCLTKETEVEMVFAALPDDQLSLYVFPRTLEIYVSCGFRLTADTSKKIKACRQSLAENEKSLKRLDRIIASSAFLSAFPVRCFELESLQPPSVALIPKKTKTTGVKPEETAMTKEPERDRSQSECISESLCQDEDDYENIEIEWNTVKSVDSETLEKVADEAPPLPPKTLRQAKPPLINSDVTQIQSPETNWKPVPKPRKRLNAMSLRCQDDSNDEPVSSQTQDSSSGHDLTGRSVSSQSSSSSGNDDYERGPDLPPKPLFLRALDTSEERNAALGESPPPLPPRPVNSALAEDLAYLVVDVTDWEAVEERALYTDPMDDGKSFVPGGVCQLNDDDNTYVDMKCKDSGLAEKYPNEASSDSDQDGTDIYEEVERNAECTSVEEKVTKIVEDYSVYTNARDDGQVFRLHDAEHLTCPLNDEPTYLEMKPDRQNLEDRKTYHEVADCTDSNAACLLNHGENPELGDGGRRDKAKAPTSFDNQSKVKEASYQEMEGPQETSEKKKTAAIETATNISGTQPRPVVTKTRHHTAIATNQRDERNFIISSPNEDDFMDFKDIQRHFKLMNELRKVNARVADLEKQVATKDELKLVEAHKQQLPAGNASQLKRDEDSKKTKSNTHDKNHNDLDSAKPFCEHSQRKAKLHKKENSIGKMQTKQTGLPSTLNLNFGPLRAKLDRGDYPISPQGQGIIDKFPTHNSNDEEDQVYEEIPENMSCGNSKRNQDDCSNTLPRHVEKEKPYDSDSDDDDDYEECCDRHFINQELKMLHKNFDEEEFAYCDMNDIPYQSKQVEKEKPYSSDLDDDDDYEECCDRHYINHEPQMSLKNFDEDEFAYCDINDEPYQYVETNRVSERVDDEDRLGVISSKTVEVTKGDRVSRYLQLDNPSEEEDSVYVNVEDEESDSDQLKQNVLQITDKRKREAKSEKITGEQETRNLHELLVSELPSV